MRSHPPSARRLVVLAIALCSFFCMLLVQFFNVQILQGEKWSRQAKLQHQFTVSEPARRGVFYSNTECTALHREQPKPFVLDIPKFHLYVDPLSIPTAHKENVALAIENLLGYTSSQKKLKLRQHLEKKTRSRKIQAWLDASQSEKIEEWWRGYAKQNKLPRNAVYAIKDFRRSYPFGHSLGQVLHTIREGIDQTCTTAVPTGGLEVFFHDLLQGKDGKKELLRSPRNPLDTGKTLQAAEDGADIYLTINHVLQAICEEEIQKAVQYAGAHSGWAILMNPHTGEILALAQYPFFTPEKYKTFFATIEDVQHTKVRAITDSFEPGSTMKPLSLTLALLANEERKERGLPLLFNPSEMVRSDDGHVAGRSKPIKDVGFHRYLNLDLAVQKSSNIYIAKTTQKIIESLGKEWYRDKLETIFGFGVKTGIELPSETSGMVPTPGKYYKSGRPEWSAPTAYSLSFGYNLQASSLQVARAYSVIANGGYLVQPSLIRKITKAGRTEYQHTPKRKKVLPKHITERITTALKYSTKPGGSGARAEVSRYSEAGKTGTTEILVHGSYSNSRHFSSFVGFAPANNPELVLYIGIFDPCTTKPHGEGKVYFGGRCAAPPFAAIMEKALSYLGVLPDDPDNTDWVKESKELRSLYLKYSHK